MLRRKTNTVADTHGNTFNLASSDENYYKALIQFTITYDKRIGSTWTNRITETYIVELKGTYNPTTTDQESDFTSNIISTLNVSRLSSADNLNILSLLESGTRTPVGSYHFRVANMGGMTQPGHSPFSFPAQATERLPETNSISSSQIQTAGSLPVYPTTTQSDSMLI